MKKLPNHTPTLKKILTKAHISPMLFQAVEDTIQALQTNNLSLACELTACKSHITGSLEPKNKQYAFQEDSAYNVTQLKDSVYSLLDNIHHDIAWKLGEMPSGMIQVLSGPKGMVWNERKPKGTHPVIKRIKFEQKQLNKEWSK
jgi:hypothetical protein